ncbi:hypothetical protein R6Q59_016730 [Mikania micrantha]
MELHRSFCSIGKGGYSIKLSSSDCRPHIPLKVLVLLSLPCYIKIAFVDEDEGLIKEGSAALRCALKLNIADIINSHNGPTTLLQIAQRIGSPSLNVGGLSRLMRFLVHKQVFDETHQPGHEETFFALNECSKLLVKDSKNTLAPIVMSFTEPLMFAPFYNLNQAIEEGCTAALKTYGVEIVTKYPHLKGVNFDLPHVDSSAPSYEGVTHVGGNMFQDIPPADSYFMKSILHNWSDGQVCPNS